MISFETAQSIFPPRTLVFRRRVPAIASRISIPKNLVMVKKSLSVSSTVVQTVEELLDELSALPPLVHCRKCGSRLLQMNSTFFSCGGKMWKHPSPVCTECEPTQFSRERADTSNRAVGAAIFSAARSRSRPPRTAGRASNPRCGSDPDPS